MNVIEFRLCDEDRARLDRVVAGLEALVLQKQSELDDALIDATGVLANHPVEGAAHLEPPADPEPAPVVKPVSLSEFQKAIVTRCAESPVVKAKVQALIHRYAASVSAVPEDKRSEVLAELAAL